MVHVILCEQNISKLFDFRACVINEYQMIERIFGLMEIHEYINTIAKPKFEKQHHIKATLKLK